MTQLFSSAGSAGPQHEEMFRLINTTFLCRSLFFSLWSQSFIRLDFLAPPLSEQVPWSAVYRYSYSQSIISLCSYFLLFSYLYPSSSSCWLPPSRVAAGRVRLLSSLQRAVSYSHTVAATAPKFFSCSGHQVSFQAILIATIDFLDVVAILIIQPAITSHEVPVLL